MPPGICGDHPWIPYRRLGKLIELVALRGHVPGCIADYEWAEERAEQLTRDAPADGVAFLARARARATFHRFTDALTDLERAQRLRADPAVVGAERTAIFQAVGRYDEALSFFREAAIPITRDSSPAS
jgi:tetratricopeptide (TPR) repeat protein